MKEEDEGGGRGLELEVSCYRVGGGGGGVYHGFPYLYTTLKARNAPLYTGGVLYRTLYWLKRVFLRGLRGGDKKPSPA